eukprot:1179587-Amorphochlora_amoeboformis.AAC.1
MLHFKVFSWGDVTPEEFVADLDNLLRLYLKEMGGTLFLFYFGHGGRSNNRDGMIFNCKTHLPLWVVEEKLQILTFRCGYAAIFFNACRTVVDGKVTNLDSMKVSKSNSANNVLVVYACKVNEEAIYSFKKGSQSERNFKKLVDKRQGLQFQAGSPFGLVVAQRLCDRESPKALHTAIELIVEDMESILQHADVPNLKNFKKLLPGWISISKSNRKPRIVGVAIILLSKMPYKYLFSKERRSALAATMDDIEKKLVRRAGEIKHGLCELDGEVTIQPEISPYSYNPEKEGYISSTNSLPPQTAIWKITAHYKV